MGEDSWYVKHSQQRCFSGDDRKEAYDLYRERVRLTRAHKRRSHLGYELASMQHQLEHYGVRLPVAPLSSNMA
jgi:phage terminase Nu1 subunit (DNA packaging protein)